VTADNGSPGVAATVAEISERASTLIREEIELAKAEINQKINQLIKGVVIGAAAGIFIVSALLFALHGFAWLLGDTVFNNVNVFWGFFIVAGALLVLGAFAGYLGVRWLRRGAPPKPEMAIEEAKRIRETVAGEEAA
jgi:hypothetical protein